MTAPFRESAIFDFALRRFARNDKRRSQPSLRLPPTTSVDAIPYGERGLGAQLRVHHTERGKKWEPDPNQWTIPVLQTIAETAKGVPELVETLAKHRDWLNRSGELGERRRKRLKERVREAVERQLQGHVWRERDGDRILEQSMPDLEAGIATPYVVADRIVKTTTAAIAATAMIFRLMGAHHRRSSDPATAPKNIDEALRRINRAATDVMMFC